MKKKSQGAQQEKAPEGSEPKAGYIYAFEVVHQYPSQRSFIIKRPLKRSFMDSLNDLFDGSKKRSTL